jgi:hypothetical protein
MDMSDPIQRLAWRVVQAWIRAEKETDETDEAA